MQTGNIKYLGVIIDKRFNFKAHIEHVTAKCRKLLFALSKSAKINWGLRSDVLKIIYNGAILPLLTYAAPIWIDAACKGSNATKLLTKTT